jgi:hypothetical protein
MGDRVWLAIGAIVVAERGLSVVIRVVMIIGGIVASEGWVLLRLVLRGDAPIHRCVVVRGGCGGRKSPCVVYRFGRP